MSDYLFDTHALVWWWTGNPALRPKTRAMILDPGNAIFVSAASAWEIAVKCRIGKWPAAKPAFEQFEDLRCADGFAAVPLTVDHGLLAGSLRGDHRDPFDRMIAAQAIHEDLTVITRDPALAALGCKTVWE